MATVSPLQGLTRYWDLETVGACEVVGALVDQDADQGGEMRLFAAIIVCLVGATACASQGGVLDDQGFTHEFEVYSVRGEPSDFIPGGRWRVANFLASNRKVKPEFERRLATEIDIDDDGKWDYRWEGLEQDLVLDSIEDGARITFASRAVSGLDGRKTLVWFTEQFTAGLSGTTEVSRLTPDTSVRTRGKRFGTRYVSGEAIEVDGLEGYKAVVDVFDADSAQGELDGPTTRLAIVVVYMPIAWPQERLEPRRLATGYSAVRPIEAGSMRLLLVATCANEVRRFASTERDCNTVLKQVRFKKDVAK